MLASVRTLIVDEIHAVADDKRGAHLALTLARLGREAPIAAASPNGPALRNPGYGSLAARALYPEGRPAGAKALPRSPVIGADSPVQYDPSEAVGGPRTRMPAVPTTGERS